MKLCLVCASGGHLTEMIRLNDAFASHEVFLVTYKEEFLNLPENVKNVYLMKNILVDRVHFNRVTKVFLIILQMLLLAREAFRILLIEKPDVIISTGSEIAIPFFYIAKIFGKKVIFIESLCRLDDLSGTGKIVIPISDLFLVQWKSLVGKYKKAEYKGNILSTNFRLSPGIKVKEESFMFVTVGTAPFPRLVESMDKIAKTLDEKVIMQIGKYSYQPKNAEYFGFKEYKEIKELNINAKVVIAHAGVGSIITALEQGKHMIVVPRLRKYGECNDDHQLEIAKLLKKQNLAEVAYEAEDILKILRSPNNKILQKSRSSVKNQSHIVESLKDFLSNDFEKKKLVKDVK